MPFGVDVAVPHEPWRAAMSDIESLAKIAVSQILELLDSPKLGELSLAFISDADIQSLNRDYRSKDEPTNVLSFPNDGPAPLLGDVVLAFETVQREAREKSIQFEHHVSHLIMHGFLHLQGYSHDNEPSAAQMEALEIRALAALNIDNPYEIHD